MGDIDRISEALGRIEAKQEYMSEQIAEIKARCDANAGCAASKSSIATWGAGAGATIAAIIEGIRHLSVK